LYRYSPGHVDEHTGHKGDDDPLDMVEVGCRRMHTGEVAEVKVGLHFSR
jgi:inorganic pyrophosphatase